MAALTSINCSARPPKSVPKGLASLGKTVSTVTTHSDTRCSCGPGAIGSVWHHATTTATSGGRSQGAGRFPWAVSSTNHDTEKSSQPLRRTTDRQDVPRSAPRAADARPGGRARQSPGHRPQGRGWGALAGAPGAGEDPDRSGAHHRSDLRSAAYRGRLRSLSRLEHRVDVPTV